MRSHQPNAAEAPLTLVCRDCDAGLDIESQGHAVAEGWSEIDYAPDLPRGNFTGLCPDCREEYRHWLTNADVEL